MSFHEKQWEEILSYHIMYMVPYVTLVSISSIIKYIHHRFDFDYFDN